MSALLLFENKGLSEVEETGAVLSGAALSLIDERWSHTTVTQLRPRDLACLEAASVGK